MSRITMDVAEDEFEFIKAAIEYKARSLVHYIEHCREISHIEEKMEAVFTQQEPKPRRGRPPMKKTTRGTRK